MEFYLERRGEGKDDAPKTPGRQQQQQPVYGLWPRCYGALLEMAAKHILHTHSLFLAAEEKERRKEGRNGGREQDAAGLMR